MKSTGKLGIKTVERNELILAALGDGKTPEQVAGLFCISKASSQQILHKLKTIGYASAEKRLCEDRYIRIFYAALKLKIDEAHIRVYEQPDNAARYDKAIMPGARFVAERHPPRQPLRSQKISIASSFSMV